jgi:D-amino-acid oxidase
MMTRRQLIQRALAGATLLGTGGCSSLGGRRGPPPAYRRRLELFPVVVGLDRVIRTTVGLRPYRESGFVVNACKLDDRMLIHNYGHGGSGMSLSWGTAHLVADLALNHPDRQAAVIGCGVVGLTSARVLQRRGFTVTVYAKAIPPETTSNMSWAAFTPTSGLISQQRRTPEWDAQFRAAVEIAYRELQLLAGRGVGLDWIESYTPIENLPAAAATADPARVDPERGMLAPGLVVGRDILMPGEHPFATRYALRRPQLRFEPSIYLDRLMHEVLAFGGRIVIRNFDTPRDLMSLSEKLIVNCTGLGAKQLFGDEELTPVRGQLVVLVPQPEVNYTVGGMLPRSDGIVLGHTMERGVWSLEINEENRKRVVEQTMRVFNAMRPPTRSPDSVRGTPSEIPAVEAFFDLES